MALKTPLAPNGLTPHYCQFLQLLLNTNLKLHYLLNRPWTLMTYSFVNATTFFFTCSSFPISSYLSYMTLPCRYIPYEDFLDSPRQCCFPSVVDPSVSQFPSLPFPVHIHPSHLYSLLPSFLFPVNCTLTFSVKNRWPCMCFLGFYSQLGCSNTCFLDYLCLCMTV